MFCTFIFAVLLLKYCCTSYISYSSQVTYNCYLLPNGVTEQSKRHSSGMTSLLACIADKIPFISTKWPYK